ncbi:hypothetical protein H6G33_24035 [Calothrix sp. FACHB-1219]|uniref:hypothetical protein n=1 Tax=Calothrix sp. FACHB-1219 TaxID=2692778 RepID=UPI00168238DE|nr:hypothetical protein [Calothrix sp. FACHB-1219]MBD2220078.1 hypothetical protein [Calothrix sp. FACHB-1219]
MSQKQAIAFNEKISPAIAFIPTNFSICSTLLITNYELSHRFLSLSLKFTLGLFK